jgi:hypothetical protein
MIGLRGEHDIFLLDNYFIFVEVAQIKKFNNLRLKINHLLTKIDKQGRP